MSSNSVSLNFSPIPHKGLLEEWDITTKQLINLIDTGLIAKPANDLELYYTQIILFEPISKDLFLILTKEGKLSLWSFLKQGLVKDYPEVYQNPICAVFDEKKIVVLAGNNLTFTDFSQIAQSPQEISSQPTKTSHVKEYSYLSWLAHKISQVVAICWKITIAAISKILTGRVHILFKACMITGITALTYFYFNNPANFRDSIT